MIYPNDEKLIQCNSGNSKYSEGFKKQKRETFKENEKVYVKKSGQELQFKNIPIYNMEGQVIKCLEEDKYLIKSKDKLFKKNHSQLVKIYP
ncbi:hypothetical protein ENBRE01_2063 [Enteropsectra breve]|nr:hypothetical protein ENBRE01_2063 [Enteropsectra breve]